MDILYIGEAQGFRNAGKAYLIPQKLINGFTRNGHNVYVFNDRDFARANNAFGSSKLGRTRLNAKVIEVAREFEPDLIVLGHCKLVENATLDAVRGVLPHVKIIYRNVDPLHSKDNVADIRDRLGHVDGVFITTAGEALKQFSNPRSFIAYMPNPIDASIETGRAFEHNCSFDVFFAGGALRHQHDQRADMLDYLQKHLKNLRLGFYGTGAGQAQIFGKDYLRRLSDSRMGLSLNKTDDYYLYASDRMAQYLGNGLLVCASRASGFQYIFASDEMIFFDDGADLAAQIRFYADHDEHRKAAAHKSWAKAHKIYDTVRITRYLIEQTFDAPRTVSGDWPLEKY